MNGFRIDMLPTDGSLGKTKIVGKGAILWSREKSGRSIFMLKRGEIEIVVPGHKSHDTVTFLVKPGENLRPILPLRKGS